jgi:selenium-binding protein 1
VIAHAREARDVLDHLRVVVGGHQRFALASVRQWFGYDVWWHLDYDTVITSEWATPSMVENGLDPEDLLGRRFGHHLNFWSLSERTLVQRVDLGDQHQLVFEVRPAHDPSKAWGFVGVVISVEDLSASVWLWHRDEASLAEGKTDRWAARKVITIPAAPANPDQLPPALQPFGAVPPLISDIDLSVDDRWLYVACWGTGELKQYDVADPFHPRETGSVRLGGIAGRQPHPAAPQQPLGGGPQMVEVSRDGRRVYLTNSLYAAWDDIFYPDGVGAWMARLDANPDHGGLAADTRFFPHDGDFRGLRVHQTRLQAGDASSDSYCFTD